MKKCSGCVRFEERWGEKEKGTYHCCRQSYTIDKFPEDVTAWEFVPDERVGEEE